MIEARIVLRYEDERTAESIFEAVSPDDFESSDLKVNSLKMGRDLVAEIKCLKLGTLIETLDDMLSCVQIAEKTIKNLKRPPI